MASGNVLLTSRGGRREDLAAYREQGGYAAFEAAVRAADPGRIVAQVEAADLRGHGGAAFPTARKWRIAAAATAAQKYVIANGGEHEPGSRKDRYLLETYPHKVLEGMLLAGLATGATRSYLYLIEDMAGPIAAVHEALAELRAARLLGDDLLGTSACFEIDVHRAPTTYVAGEETAAIDSIEGGPGKPRAKPPYPGSAGLHGCPTTVNNVETLAHVPWILRHGAEAYRALGHGGSAGTMLFTLGDQVQRPGVYELPFGSTYRQLIQECGGGTREGRPIRAILPALSAAFLPPSALDVPISHAALKELGSSPGCGGVHLVLEGDAVVEKILEIAQFFMDEQCGQCPPCRMETNQFVHILKAVQGGKPGDFASPLRRIADFTRGKGNCSLIEMAAAPVLSAIDLFHADLEACSNPPAS